MVMNQGRDANEDDSLYVEFSVAARLNPAKSREAKSPVWENVERIRVVWDNEDSVLDRPLVDTEDEYGNIIPDPMKERFAAKYEAFKKGVSATSFGTPLSELFPADPAKVKVYEKSSIYSCEQLASLPDSTAQSIGMGAIQDRKLAKEYLEHLKSKWTSAAHEEQFKAMEEKNLDLAEQLKDTNAKLEKLLKEREKEAKKEK